MKVELEIELLSALQRVGIKNLALRASQLSEDSLETIIAIANTIALREKQNGKREGRD